MILNYLKYYLYKYEVQNTNTKIKRCITVYFIQITISISLILTLFKNNRTILIHTFIMSTSDSNLI